MDTMVETRKELENVTDVTAGEDSIISVSVDAEDPKRAAAMANAFVEELDRMVQSLAVTKAAQRRLFFERQLKEAKEALTLAESELRKTQEASGLIQLEDQAKAIITASANVKAQVIAKETEIAAMRTYAAPSNPEFTRAHEQLAGLKDELAALQKRHNLSLEGNVIVPTGNIPEADLDYIRRLRDVKFQEALFEILAKQFELAKIDEAKDAAIVQVVDRAVVTCPL